MARALLSAEEFSRVVACRARREWPEARIETMGNTMLVVEAEPGQRRLISLDSLYLIYCESPLDRDEVIGDFLASLIYEAPARIAGSFADNQHKVLPQLVPPSLVDFCRQEHRDLASMDYVGGLAVAFVLDEPERYAYLHRTVTDRWEVDDRSLLAAAVRNLERLDRDSTPFARFGREKRLSVVWETFDGYDASRILLTRRLNEVAAEVAGNPVIGIPNRDYMVLFGDADADFADEMADRMREDFEAHPFPISPQLFTLRDGNLALYQWSGGQRLLN